MHAVLPLTTSLSPVRQQCCGLFLYTLSNLHGLPREGHYCSLSPLVLVEHLDESENLYLKMIGEGSGIPKAWSGVANGVGRDGKRGNRPEAPRWRPHTFPKGHSVKECPYAGYFREYIDVRQPLLHNPSTTRSPEGSTVLMHSSVHMALGGIEEGGSQVHENITEGTPEGVGTQRKRTP